MKVLIIGNGGREHAIAWKLKQSPIVSKIYCAPGNGGTASFCENVVFNNIEELAQFALNEEIELTVVGPEVYLAQGTTDVFQSKGLKVYGPIQAASRLESSKVFAKDFMKKYKIPSAAYETFSNANAAKDYIKKMGVPIVVKADGLAAGKGVIVAFDLETAFKAVDDIMTDRVFGEAGIKVVVEEFLEGEEASLLAFCDGVKAVPMLPAQDHKRIGDNDTGPNTGGMGTYAPTSAVTKDILIQITEDILNPTIKAMQTEGTPFVGTLFVGLMLTKNGPKVIEYNVRFGDPETQVVLPLLESDLAQIFLDAVSGNLQPESIKWQTGKTAVCVVTASGGYPGKYEIGKVITGVNELKNSLVFHAGTKNENGVLLTTGGRVLNIVNIANNVAEAINGVYQELPKVRFDGVYYRNDIAKRELERF